MILLDEEDLRQEKLDALSTGTTLRLPERALTGRLSSSLPDYDTSEAEHKLLRTSFIQKRTHWRCWRATFYALVIYLILSVVIGVPIIIVRGNRHSRKHDSYLLWDYSIVPLNLISTSVPVDTGTACEWNSTYDDLPRGIFLAKVGYTLDASGSFSIRSNASDDASQATGIKGDLVVGINPDAKATEAVFRIKLRSSSGELRQRTMVCFGVTGNQSEFFIYVPSNLTDVDFLSFDVRFLLPQTSSLRNFDDFVTSLPWFSQSFGNFTRHTKFDNVLIEGAGQNITCDFFMANQISVKNCLAAIQGNFNVSQSLALDTVKGAIFANITLVNDLTSQTPTYLTLDTGDNEIDSRVTLLTPPSRSTLEPSHPPVFVAQVNSFNSPLNLNISHDSSTPPMPMQLRVQNNREEVNVVLDSKFEGTFNVHAKLAQAVVRKSDAHDVVDPTGGNRVRKVVYDVTSSSHARGWVGWGKRPLHGNGGQGRIDILSSLSPVLLQFGP